MQTIETIETITLQRMLGNTACTALAAIWSHLPSLRWWALTPEHTVLVVVAG
jgi:hypothetical protein